MACGPRHNCDTPVPQAVQVCQGQFGGQVMIENDVGYIFTRAVR